MDTVTSTTLLESIKDRKNHRAWNRFTRRYRPMVISFAKRMGLNKSDAEDLSQETLLAFIEHYHNGEFHREKGGLRTWLFTIARRKMIDARRKYMQETVLREDANDTSVFESLESPDLIEKVWEEEWQHAVLRACMALVAREVTPQTLAAFNLHFLKEWPVEKVAAHLHMTSNAVYRAKYHVLIRVRRVRPQVEESW